MKNPFERSVVEAPVSYPKIKEKTLLELAAKGPVGRWLSMAAIALSTEGCAQLGAIITGEGISTGGVKPRFGIRQYGDGDTYASFSMEMGEEKPGMRIWWR
jgi:hypothetical protein